MSIVQSNATPEEAAAEIARQNTLLKRQKKWRHKMRGSDDILSRMIEDVYDALDAPAQARVAQTTRDKVAMKKALRATKPE